LNLLAVSRGSMCTGTEDTFAKSGSRHALFAPNFIDH